LAGVGAQALRKEAWWAMCSPIKLAIKKYEWS
jgi:hypothetical protein